MAARTALAPSYWLFKSAGGTGKEKTGETPENRTMTSDDTVADFGQRGKKWQVPIAPPPEFARPRSMSPQQKCRCSPRIDLAAFIDVLDRLRKFPLRDLRKLRGNFLIRFIVDPIAGAHPPALNPETAERTFTVVDQDR